MLLLIFPRSFALMGVMGVLPVDLKKPKKLIKKPKKLIVFSLDVQFTRVLFGSPVPYLKRI
jgi:hypothetical protein